ncbi:hypothetical protein A3D81_02025 [Candidatus Curtissbacteria bacterium RIFCSPHIGHO2_02_FULL_40_17]|uniref:Peptidase S54 rhomboid domain-containing protein n=4 Tax=Candidatus Curtissiibacteriota TaxID=1752717 RepID=A0A1F5GGS8_9BACT|nr:MAG: hypothetical protein A2693_03480 [Candidatus Curtissbacteria bacterium RIFCSPHIGHO2_01_FULL_40_12]OGD91068.1 MAG: hypothetical protein A3D81_02025 [Candidatus Curtissbacteria bacterium RIFCSPHIGHO2_02_FULL_40_17]OGE05478.1 MAG: hypothetical protein A3F45_03815 [Candidatus Curtissbacteria bacterium RIFCSPHIGHO2_12_FULL_41_17]OGE07120.1 MAG: hypothetical protein A3I53_02885 [Candidatus Curtissbacteria bacterium RIFCSPLOWO2_02_FULL_40_13b]
MFPIRDTRNSGKFPIVNLILIGFNIYVFILELFSPNIEVFIAQYSLIPQNVNFFNIQTLKPFVTSMFLHAGFLHILSNMWFLWIFGDNVEAAIGHIKYLIFFIFCGVAASFIQYLFIANSTLPMIGASGAIAGVLGAYLKLFPKNKVDTIIPIFGLPFFIALPAYFMLIYWFVIQAFNGVASIIVATASVGGVAYLAHAGGFLTGFLVSRSLVWQRLGR